MDAIIPALTHQIPSELRSEACLGESSTRMGDPLGSPRVASLLFSKFGRVIEKVYLFILCRNYVVRTSDGGVKEGRDGRHHMSVRVEARSVGGRLGHWEEGGVR
ncbi:hypothetical protein KY284_000949 [Solanum tuberosum]|nr:hypothetical protein KY284_000949 [Solanum tuberosum]